ncbi:MAG: hypothetical protein HY294_03800 [Candidatus Rokubacteria bacterium]|nr:hypothetical protein [Candidatus Rokubacteria bacterium]MBI3825100.1 hypothetical protein [Candidatus Rokubacteria bacterium]
MSARPHTAFPWFLVAACLIMAALLLYVMFIGYLPARQRATRLEAELKQVYAREAALQTRLVQQEQRQALREQQTTAVARERDALAQRLEDAERELAVLRGRKR